MFGMVIMSAFVSLISQLRSDYHLAFAPAVTVLVFTVKTERQTADTNAYQQQAESEPQWFSLTSAPQHH